MFVSQSSVCICLFIFSSLFGLIQSSTAISRVTYESSFNPDILLRNCTIGESCSSSINSTTVHYYSIEYPYDPSLAVRVTTSMEYKIEQDAPLLVVVRQVRGVLSWTLPFAFPNGMLYSTASRILCLHNEANRTHSHVSTLFIEISTSNKELINYSLQLNNMTDYLLNTGVERKINVSPAMPMFFKYTFPPGVDNVFIAVQSNDHLCAVVSVQSFDCPVYDVNEIGVRQGHYQTMSTRASFNVYASEFPKRNEFLLVVLVKPTDVDCLNYQEQAAIQPAGYIDIQRNKNATIIVDEPDHSNYLYVTIFATIAVFFVVYVVALGIMCKRPDIYDDIELDRTPILESTVERELTDQRSTGASNQTTEGEENIVEASNRADFDRSESLVAAIGASRTGFVSVNELCSKDYQHLKEKFRIYPQTMLTIAIFYSLPVIQLVIQYQVNIDESGNEDLCYFNFLCTRQFAMFTAFNNIFSNIGYCVLGVLFLLIIVRRDRAYTRFLQKFPQREKECGIPQHYGLFYAMAIGLIMEGIMSACYHVCPSKANFQFDTSFMFIIAVLNIIKIYQIRHPDINPRSAGAFSFLALIILINVIGVYFDQQWFWIVYCIFHIVLCIIFTGKIYYMGRLKVSWRVHRHLFRLLTENGWFSRPRYFNRLLLLVMANFVNIGFAIYGAAFQPESFPNHLLFVLLGNLALYLLYYIVMKLFHRERFTMVAVLSLILATIFWGSSLNFFYQEVKSYEVQPAISRERNRPCVLLKTYDVHDVWHLLSSFGLFFSFLSILTMDDGIRGKKRTEIAAF